MELFKKPSPGVLAPLTLPRRRSGGERGSRSGGSDPAIQRQRLALQSERLALQKKNAERNWAYKLANFERMVNKDKRDTFFKFYNTLGRGGRPRGNRIVAPKISLGGAVDRMSKAKAQVEDHIGKALEVMRGSGLPTGIAQSVGKMKRRGGTQR